MCKKCLKNVMPDRGSTCLETGAYVLNFAGCAGCGKLDFLRQSNAKGVVAALWLPRLPAAADDGNDGVEGAAGGQPGLGGSPGEQSGAAAACGGATCDNTGDDRDEEGADTDAGQEKESGDDSDDESGDEDDEDVTYTHLCNACGHVVAEHNYTFSIDREYQEYTMECALCGYGNHTQSIMPTDERKARFF